MRQRLLLAIVLIATTVAAMAAHRSPKASPKGPQVVTMNVTMPPQARAMLLKDDTLTMSQRLRLDSIFAVAKCWRFIRPPQPFAATSTCPDSAEAAALIQYAPMFRATAAGMRGMMRVGDHLQLQAVNINGFLFVGPKMVPLTPPKTTSGA